MDRNRVVSYLAAMTDDEFAALQADARAQPTHPLAQVRASVAAKVAQLAAQPRTASGFPPATTPEPEPQELFNALNNGASAAPEPPAAQGTWAVNRGQGYAGNGGAVPVQQKTVLERIGAKLDLNRIEGNQ